MNISVILQNSALMFPGRPAICENGLEISYSELNVLANRVASGLLRLGICPGDVIAICAPNSTEWIAVYFGAIRAGAVVATLPLLLQGPELKQLIREAMPRMIYSAPEKFHELDHLRQSGMLQTIICHGGDINFDELIRMGSAEFKPVDRDREDTCAILFTGGTTGVPKGAMLSHENIYTAIRNVVFNEKSGETDRALCFLPLNHVFGQMHILNATLLSGGCIELMSSFDMDRILEAMSTGRITKLFAVPTVYVRLLSLTRLKESLGTVRYCFSAAASMAEETVRQWQERTGLAVYEAYGMTESASMVTYNHYHRHVIGSVGTPVGTVEVQIRDMDGNILEADQIGEICIRGRNVMKGYLNRPEETRAVFWDDWFRSGDMGRIDSNGYLFIVDRLKDMIITGGENVYPREVEELLYTRPEIQECAVIGMPDSEWGERITAFIIPAPDQSVDTAALKTYLKSNLSSFKVPKEFRIVDTLPKSPAGKILKRELRNQFVTPKNR
ncbi:MAG: class I adenylate-forming enzyme family protein [Desulfatirhabdiaceae bacterium]